MQRVENLISIVRKMTGNGRYDADSGIPQSVMVQHLNDAQDSLTKQVQNLQTKFFLTTKTVPVVSGQAIYEWPSDCYVRAMDTVQWSDGNSGVYYQTVYKTYTKEKVTAQLGYPFGYIPKHDGLEMNPPINNGILYLTYEKTIPKLQKRSGTVTTAAIVGDQLTALSVSISEPYDETEINSDYYLCVVDKFGNIKARDIQYDSVSAGVFILSPFTLPSGETISIGDSILVGKNTCNVPNYPDICETFLRKYAIYQVRYGDSSKWSNEAFKDMEREFALLSGTFEKLSEDITEIAITNLDYISF